MKHLLLIASLLCGQLLLAQTQWSGVVQLKPWSKTTESFCAQGSDYYVLELKTDTYVLEFADDKVAAQIARMTGKHVSVTGTLEKRTIEPDAGSQHPVDSPPVMQMPQSQQPVLQQPVEQRPVTTISRPGSQDVSVSQAFTCTVLRVTKVQLQKRR